MGGPSLLHEAGRRANVNTIRQPPIDEEHI